MMVFYGSSFSFQHLKLKETITKVLQVAKEKNEDGNLKRILWYTRYDETRNRTLLEFKKMNDVEHVNEDGIRLKNGNFIYIYLMNDRIDPNHIFPDLIVFDGKAGMNPKWVERALSCSQIHPHDEIDILQEAE